MERDAFECDGGREGTTGRAPNGDGRHDVPSGRSGRGRASARGGARVVAGRRRIARTEKEEGHVEYEELEIRLARGREKLLRITREASRLERETAEASRALEEARGGAREDDG